MLKPLRKTLILLAMTAAIAAPAYPGESKSPKPQESPWAMRAPAAVPQGAPTLSAQQRAAQEAAEKGTPDQQAFARKVANAMSAKDYSAMKELIAPSTLKCIGKNEDYLQDRIKRQFELPINRKFKLRVTKLPPNITAPSKYATYPMLPTHLMGMDFTAPDGNQDTINLPIGQEAGKWYEAQPCPTAEGMVRFGKLQHMRAVQREHAKTAMAQVKDPIKSQLLGLIGKHNTVGAWRMCMSSLHYDFPTCRGVVALLAGEEDY
jgi:hypothetical protein